MAVANTKSTIVTNADASPRVLSNSAIHKGHLRYACGTVEVAAADDDNSVYRMVRLPANAKIVSLEILNDAITAGTVYHLGAYQTSQNGGAVVDLDAFASSIDMTSARTLPFNAMYEAGTGTVGVEDIETLLWQMLGVASDPMRDYDICFTAATVGSAAGTLSLQALFSI
jgi:hypothetical protein